MGLGRLGFIMVLALVITITHTNNINAAEARHVMMPRGLVPPFRPHHDPPGHPPKTSSSGFLAVSTTSYHTLSFKGVPHPPGGPSHGINHDTPGTPPNHS
ncbi:hypothetical protein DCAR_0415891 [Daucus carota subsp. sativus]|uniref:Uncharacterized protein n=1 Tax=Daucus carota subsp. sativus TaxID=79200 RepID=A0A165WVC6_DAUCS|nr:hypothetical protein DCAR_0415891 [Daucus carota subsp. sativus]